MSNFIPALVATCSKQKFVLCDIHKLIFKPVLINNLSYVTLRPISMFPGKVALVKFDYIQYEYKIVPLS